jgi:exosortase B
MRTLLHDVYQSARLKPAWPLFGLLIGLTYLPSIVQLSRTEWQSDQGSYGPLILLATLFVIWSKRGRLMDVTSVTACCVGGLLLTLGLLSYVVGRSQDIIQLNVGSAIAVLAGSVLILGGWPSLRVMAFPILYLFFCVPLPGVVVVAMTEALKVLASSAAEQSLWWMGYPVARTGVMLLVGPYRLLVADACSGLNSLISLAALGLLYLYLVGKRGRIRQLLMIAAIVPVALTANVVRIDVLAMITFHWGAAAGQGFLHEADGLVVFAVALGLFVALDRLLACEWLPRFKGTA